MADVQVVGRGAFALPASILMYTFAVNVPTALREVIPRRPHFCLAPMLHMQRGSLFRETYFFLLQT